MGFAKEPLTEEEEAKVLTAATLHSDFAHKLCLLLRFSGLHISVFYNPKRNLRIRNADGLDHFLWDRPKKKGVVAITSVPVHRELKPWIYDFIKDSHSEKKSDYDHLFEEISAIAEMKISPMSFRHTLGVRLLDKGKTKQFVMQTLNCTREVADRYAKYSKRQMREGWEDLDWF